MPQIIRLDGSGTAGVPLRESSKPESNVIGPSIADPSSRVTLVKVTVWAKSLTTSPYVAVASAQARKLKRYPPYASE